MKSSCGWDIQQFSAQNGIGFSKFDEEPNQTNTPKRGIIPRLRKASNKPIETEIVREVPLQNCFNTFEGMHVEDDIIPTLTSSELLPKDGWDVYNQNQYMLWNDGFIPSPPPSPPPPPPPLPPQGEFEPSYPSNYLVQDTTSGYDVAFQPLEFTQQLPTQSSILNDSQQGVFEADSYLVQDVPAEGLVAELAAKLKMSKKPIPENTLSDRPTGVVLSEIAAQLQPSTGRNFKEEEFEFPEYFWDANLDDYQQVTPKEDPYLKVVVQTSKSNKLATDSKQIIKSTPINATEVKIKVKNNPSANVLFWYTQFLWKQCSTPSGLSHVKFIEKQFYSLLHSKQDCGVMLPAMNSLKRRIVHELGLFYRIHIKSYDKEPNRSCFIKRNKNSKIPFVVLSSSTNEPETTALNHLKTNNNSERVILIRDVLNAMPLSKYNLILHPVIGSFILLKRQSSSGGGGGGGNHVDVVAVFTSVAKMLVAERLLKKRIDNMIVRLSDWEQNSLQATTSVSDDDDVHSCYSEPDFESFPPQQFQEGWSQLPMKSGQLQSVPVVQKEEKYADMGWMRNTFAGLKQTR